MIKQSQISFYASSEFKDLCKSCPSSSIYLPQELLALSTALSATLTAQLAFDPSQLKYCSTYRLAEAVDQENKQHGIYHLGSEYELAVTPKKITSFSNFLDSFSRCFAKFRQYLEDFVDHNFFQRLRDLPKLLFILIPEISINAKILIKGFSKISYMFVSFSFFKF